MASQRYIDLLRDPRWQRRRLEIFNRDKFTCQGCAETDRTLHVHHKRYIPGRPPWDSPNDDLITLCEACHRLAKETRDRIVGAVAEMTIDEMLAIAGVATAMIARARGDEFTPQLPGEAYGVAVIEKIKLEDVWEIEDRFRIGVDS